MKTIISSNVTGFQGRLRLAGEGWDSALALVFSRRIVHSESGRKSLKKFLGVVMVLSLVIWGGLGFVWVPGVSSIGGGV